MGASERVDAARPLFQASLGPLPVGGPSCSWEKVFRGAPRVEKWPRPAPVEPIRGSSVECGVADGEDLPRETVGAGRAQTRVAIQCMCTLRYPMPGWCELGPSPLDPNVVEGGPTHRARPPLLPWSGALAPSLPT